MFDHLQQFYTLLFFIFCYFFELNLVSLNFYDYDPPPGIILIFPLNYSLQLT